MAATPHPAAGLGSRVALRTFLLFCLCSIVPVILFAVFGYRFVSTQLDEHARTRLNEASKRYGVLLYERLSETQALLAELARMHAQGRALSPEESIFGSRVRVVSISELPQRDAVDPRSGALEFASADGTTTVRLAVTARTAIRSVRLVGEIDPQYLWSDDATGVSQSSLCVTTSAGMVLHCEQPGFGGGNTGLEGQWRLFLRAQFGVDDWTIRAWQANDAALDTRRSFAITLLFVAALAVAVSLLLSAIHIRRSHGPLSVLTAATRRMSRGRFDGPIRIASGDEYAGLGRAFNRMGSSLRRQFRLLSTFAHVDQLILARSAIGPVVEALLPKIRGLLRCEVAAVVLWNRAADIGRVFIVRSERPEHLELARTPINEQMLAAVSPDTTRSLTGAQFAAAMPEALRTLHAHHWTVASIRVGNLARGSLLLGRSSPGERRRDMTRYVSGFAQRLAVAVGNEDREQALLRQAYYDSLTGLPNRQLFKDRLEQQLAIARRGDSGCALLFIDLDRFKNVNDSLGHTAGDELLKAAADRLAATLRESDTLARIGGDEFTVIAPEMSAREATALAGRIHEALTTPLDIQGVACVVQASIGVALFPHDGSDAEMLIRNADTAMYRAKAAGGATVAFFEEAMNENAVRRLRLEHRLREALAQDRLTLFYQRKVRATDESTVGVEALARWFDDEEGAISPAEFIPIAEDCGLIGELDRWAVRSACRAASRWSRLGLAIGHVAVNVSLRHLRDDSFAHFVADTLREHDLAPDALELEITESTLAEDPEHVAQLLSRIRSLGVRIAIDDFGTGYSSMTTLQQLPIDILKIDRAFVTDCVKTESAGALLKALVLAARGLGKEVVAEGVETLTQAQFLRMHGCDFLQGYLYARPVPASELEKSIAAEPEKLRA
jgi:diguanylate cyclase (GGDEF)-like protein